MEEEMPVVEVEVDGCGKARICGVMDTDRLVEGVKAAMLIEERHRRRKEAEENEGKEPR